MIPMASFFDKSLSIRSLMKELIQNENQEAPLSDSALASQLKGHGYELARRTVAKYRAMEGILPAYQRKVNQ
jgi:RNA polymerase sigma-54 factor